jgi:thiol-disulfide isomerase/thioredoxin
MAGRFRLADFRDQFVLLDFWATWCAPCRAEFPVLEKVEKAFAPKGLSVLRITDQPPEIVRDFLRNYGHDFPTLINGESVSRQYHVGAIPTLVLIDKTSKIAGYDVKVLTESDLRDRLRKVGIE